MRERAQPRVWSLGGNEQRVRGRKGGVGMRQRRQKIPKMGGGGRARRNVRCVCVCGRAPACKHAEDGEWRKREEGRGKGRGRGAKVSAPACKHAENAAARFRPITEGVRERGAASMRFFQRLGRLMRQGGQVSLDQHVSFLGIHTRCLEVSRFRSTKRSTKRFRSTKRDTRCLEVFIRVA